MAAELAADLVSGWNGTTFTVRKTLFVAGKKFDGFVLHVHYGDNYGFPACNDTAPGKCEGFTKPFRTFTPHTDLMGIAVRSGTLHLTSFAGPKGKGPGGEVFTLCLNSSVLKPLLKGFVAPVVGLGLHHGYVYVGELTGQMFRVRV